MTLNEEPTGGFLLTLQYYSTPSRNKQNGMLATWHTSSTLEDTGFVWFQKATAIEASYKGFPNDSKCKDILATVGNLNRSTASITRRA